MHNEKKWGWPIEKEGKQKDRRKKAESWFQVGQKKSKRRALFREVIKKERRKLVAFDWLFIIFGI